MTNEIVKILLCEFKVTDIKLAEQKAIEWQKQYPTLNIPNEIIKASRWESVNRKPQARYKDKIKFLGNWFRKAGGYHKHVLNIYQYWNEKFQEKHAGIHYESTPRDISILSEIHQSRGTVKTIILIEAFFLQSESNKYIFFSVAPRTIPAFKSAINEMVAHSKVQKAYLNTKTIEMKLKQTGKI
jgi:hypothetical protein